jgi:hypothetical protein
MKNRGTNGFKT